MAEKREQLIPSLHPLEFSTKCIPPPFFNGDCIYNKIDTWICRLTWGRGKEGHLSRGDSPFSLSTHLTFPISFFEGRKRKKEDSFEQGFYERLRPFKWFALSHRQTRNGIFRQNKKPCVHVSFLKNIYLNLFFWKNTFLTFRYAPNSFP